MKTTIAEIDLSVPLKKAQRRVELDLQRKYLVAALTRTAGNVGLSARLLGVSRRMVTYLIAEFELDRQKFREAAATGTTAYDK